MSSRRIHCREVEQITDAQHRRPLEYIAFWQFLGFLLLVVLIWLNAVFDLSLLFFRVPSRGSWFGACALTAVTIVVGFIIVAHTYVQQKRELKGLIHICSYCRKVQLNPRAWEQLEQFISKRTLTKFTHVICPACQEQAMRDAIEAGDGESQAASSDS